jgi:hypothetical protein
MRSPRNVAFEESQSSILTDAAKFVGSIVHSVRNRLQKIVREQNVPSLRDANERQ